MCGKVTVMMVMIRVRVEVPERVTVVIWRRDRGVGCSSLAEKKREREMSRR